MKRMVFALAVTVIFAMVPLMAAGCGGGGAAPAGGTATSVAPPAGLVTTSSDAGAGTAASSTTASLVDSTSVAPSGGAGSESRQVFQPHELLSAEEASAITTFAVTLDDGSLFKDEESGVISERYKYDLGGSGIHALVEIHQDSLKTSDGSVKDLFLAEKKLSQNGTARLGDDAFTADEGQLHMLYGGYYIVVAFDADPYSSDLNAPLNLKLGAKILENLKAKLG